MKNITRIVVILLAIALLNACNIGNSAQSNLTQQSQPPQNLNLTNHPLQSINNLKNLNQYTSHIETSESNIYKIYIETSESIIIATQNIDNNSLTINSTMPIKANSQLKGDNVVTDSSNSYAYVLDASQYTLLLYTIDQKSGQFLSLPNANRINFGPNTLLTDIKRVTLESNDYIYVTSTNKLNQSGLIYIYKITENSNNGNGSLTPIALDPIITTPNPTTITIDNNDLSAYIIDESSSSIYEYKINESTGNLSFIDSITPEPNSTILTKMIITKMTSNNSQHQYIANIVSSNYIYSYSVDHASGKMNLLNKTTTQYNTLPMTMFSIPAFLGLGLAYATNNSNLVTYIVNNDGSLSISNQQTFLPNKQFLNIQLDPTGTLAYAFTNQTQMEVYFIDKYLDFNYIQTLNTINPAFSGFFIDQF